MLQVTQMSVKYATMVIIGPLQLGIFHYSMAFSSVLPSSLCKGLLYQHYPCLDTWIHGASNKYKFPFPHTPFNQNLAGLSSLFY